MNTPVPEYSIAIRAATLADAADLATIYNHYVMNTVVTFEEAPVSAADMSTRIEEIQRLGLPWLVAELDGTLAGYAYASRWKPRSAYRHSVETTVYLRNGLESRGIGKVLYSALFAPLRSWGARAVIGGAALPNPACEALHQSLGFERIATFRQVGFKHGRWVDVGYWQRILAGEST